MFDISTIILFTLIVSLSLIASYKIEKDWTTPIFLVLCWIFLFIVGDSWYTLYSKEYGPGSHTRFILQTNQLGIVTLIWTTAVIFLLVGYSTTSIFFKKTLNKKLKDLNDSKQSVISKFSYDLSTLLLLFSFVVTTLSLIYISLLAMKEGYSLNEVSQLRNKIFSDGGGYLLLFVQTFKYATLIWVYYHIKSIKIDGKKINYRYILFLITISLSIDLFLGTRSSFAYGFLLPLLIIMHKSYKKISIKKVGLITFAIFVFVGVVYRTIARDQFFISNQGGDLSKLIIANLKTMPDFFWGGFEASSFDGALDIIDKLKFSPPLLTYSLCAINILITSILCCK